jgi:C4-dicarboxylate transporter/malic acid transport protein
MENPMSDVLGKPQTLNAHPFAPLARPLEIVRQFTPNWFAATMGTGILSIVLAQLPVAGSWARSLGEGLWLFNIGLYGLFTLIYAARWALFFQEAKAIFAHPVASMFFGCIPMGLATLVNGAILFGRDHWGGQAVAVAEVLWRIDVVLSLACGIAIPYAMFTRQTHSLEKMTAVWLLPIVAAEVAAASGGLLAPLLPDPHGRLLVLVSGYVLWGYSVPAALSLLVVLLLRMILHRLPPAALAASSWLALGPIGTAALGLLLLGAAAPDILAHNGLGELGPAIKAADLVGALALWGYGLWWMGLAILITLRQLRLGLPFNLGWWGYTFPLGVFTAATLKLAALLPLPIFTSTAQVLALFLAAIWLVVSARTLTGVWRGELFGALPDARNP